MVEARLDYRSSRELTRRVVGREQLTRKRAVQFTVMLQVKSLFLSPVQYLPPFAGTGRSHSRSEYLMPPPQVLLQDPTGPHSPHPPCTAAGRVPMSTHFLWMHHWTRATDTHTHTQADTPLFYYIAFTPRIRTTAICLAGSPPMNPSPRARSLPANTNFQRGEPRSFLTLQFISQARLNLRAATAEGDEIYIREERGDATRDEEDASFNKSLSAGDRNILLFSASDGVPGHASNASRKWLSTQSPFDSLARSLAFPRDSTFANN